MKRYLHKYQSTHTGEKIFNVISVKVSIGHHLKDCMLTIHEGVEKIQLLNMSEIIQFKTLLTPDFIKNDLNLLTN